LLPARRWRPPQLVRKGLHGSIAPVNLAATNPFNASLSIRKHQTVTVVYPFLRVGVELDDGAVGVKAILRIFRIPRKVLFIIGGLGLLGGVASAAAYVYLHQELIFGPSEETLNGLACTPVKTFNIKQDDRYWIRAFIKTAPTDGPMRVKTALRVAKAINEEKHPDLVQVVVLDEHGPEQRADMRGRAVGADVVFIAHPEKIPDYNAQGGFTAKYIDGSANSDGDFYGNKVVVPKEEIDKITSLFDKIEGCVDPEEAAKKSGSGGHGAAPAGGHGGSKSESGHGESAPEGDGHGSEQKDGGGHGEGHGGGDTETPVASAEEPSFFSKMLSMVGLGSDSPTEGGHGEGVEAVASNGAEGGGHGDAAADGHGAAADAGADHGAASTGHGEAVASESPTGGGHGEPNSGGHGPAADAPVVAHDETDGHGNAPTENANAGHGGGGDAATGHETVADGHGAHGEPATHAVIAEDAPADAGHVPAIQEAGHGSAVAEEVGHGSQPEETHAEAAVEDSDHGAAPAIDAEAVTGAAGIGEDPHGSAEKPLVKQTEEEDGGDHKPSGH
jgi:hypothetical protein